MLLWLMNLDFAGTESAVIVWTIQTPDATSWSDQTADTTIWTDQTPDDTTWTES